MGVPAPSASAAVKHRVMVVVVVGGAPIGAPPVDGARAHTRVRVFGAGPATPVQRTEAS